MALTTSGLPSVQFLTWDLGSHRSATRKSLPGDVLYTLSFAPGDAPTGA